MDDFDEFKKVIKGYAKAYSEFERIQEKMSFIPEKGDQKTGIIGEAFVFEYLKRINQQNLHFGSHSEKGWDIESKGLRYQVKTVSAFSKTEELSPIHDGWDFLYLIKLDGSFLPCRVLKIENPHNWNKSKITGKKYPKEGIKVFNICGIPCSIIDETSTFIEVLNIKNT